MSTQSRIALMYRVKRLLLVKVRSTGLFKAGNDRCEIQVTEGAIPNCGVSNDLCSPSCPADE